MDEDEDLALPNDAEDMHKMLTIRKQELKQLKEHKTQFKPKAGLNKSDNSGQNNLIDAKQSTSSYCDLFSG